MAFQGTLLGSRSAPNRLTPRLVFHIELQNNSGEQVTVLGITGEMRLKRDNRYLGLASLNTLLIPSSIATHNKAPFELEVDLSFRQIEIIEGERGR